MRDPIIKPNCTATWLHFINPHLFLFLHFLTRVLMSILSTNQLWMARWLHNGLVLVVLCSQLIALKYSQCRHTLHFPHSQMYSNDSSWWLCFLQTLCPLLWKKWWAKSLKQILSVRNLALFSWCIKSYVLLSDMYSLSSSL